MNMLRRHSQFENNRKIKWYTSDNCVLSHKQVIITGIRKDRSKYKIVCDEGMKNFIIELNNKNFRTLWSCEGGNGSTPYLVVSKYKLSEENILELTNMIKNYWKDYYYIETFIERDEIKFYGYKTEVIYNKHLKFLEEWQKDFKY